MRNKVYLTDVSIVHGFVYVVKVSSVKIGIISWCICEQAWSLASFVKAFISKKKWVFTQI